MATPYVDNHAELPPPELRGNNNAHFRTRAKLRKEMRRLAKAKGERWLTRNGALRPPYLASVSTGNTRADLDNVLYGLKAEWDGLADAGVIEDDKHIVGMSIKRDARLGQREIRIRIYGK